MANSATCVVNMGQGKTPIVAKSFVSVVQNTDESRVGVLYSGDLPLLGMAMQLTTKTFLEELRKMPKKDQKDYMRMFSITEEDLNHAQD